MALGKLALNGLTMFFNLQPCVTSIPDPFAVVIVALSVLPVAETAAVADTKWPHQLASRSKRKQTLGANITAPKGLQPRPHQHKRQDSWNRAQNRTQNVVA